MTRTFHELRNLILMILFLPSLYATAQNCCNADFTFQKANNTFQFIPNDIGNANSWHWDLGDGNQRSEASPVHTYSMPGNYAVTFTKQRISFDPLTQDTIRTSCSVTRYIQVEGSQTCNAEFAFQQSRKLVYFYPTDFNTTGNSYWSFGDGSYSSELYPYHQYANAGVYTVCHIKNDGQPYNIYDSSNYCQSCREITVVDPGNSDTCDARFTHTTTGNTTSFSFRALAGGEFEYWYFGDGAGSSESNPLHTYNSTGSYSVSHYVFKYEYDSATNYFDSDTCIDIQTIIISDSINYDTCSAYFNHDISGNSVSFTSYGADENDYQTWNFGDGHSSSSSNPSHTYSSAGTYVVSHTVHQRYNAWDTCTFQSVITISDSINKDSCSAYFTQTIAGNFVSFSSYADANNHQIWNFGDGHFANGSSPTHTYTGAGSYVVTHTVFQRYGSNWDTCTAESVITISDSIDHDTCSAYFGYQILNKTVFLNSYGTDGNDYQIWQFGDGQISTESNPTHTYAGAGTYVITHEVLKFDPDSTGFPYSDTCRVQYVITISDPVNTDTCFAYFNQTISGRTAAFNSIGGDASDDHVWNFGDGASAYTANPTHTYSQAGTYTVSHMVFNYYDSTGQFIDTCTVQSVITISDSIQQDSCNADFNYSVSGKNVSFTSHVADGNDYEFWQFGDGQFSTENLPQHSYAHAGTYVVTHTVLTYYEFNGGFRYSDTCKAQYIITVTDPINHDSCFAGFDWFLRDDTLVVQSTVPNAQHSWNFGDGSPVSGNATSRHIYRNDGVYNVCHTAIVNGDSCTTCEQITLLKPEVLPNPTNDLLVIRSSQGDLKFYYLYDMYGNTIANAFDINAASATITTSTIPSGSYILAVSYASGSISRYSIIVQH